MRIEVGETIDHIRYNGITNGNVEMVHQLTRDLEGYFKMDLKNDETT